ncbi:MAG TPA: nitrous oxide reductase accessory protein NosL [Hanamia sp.]
MKNNKLTGYARWLTALCSVILFAVLFFPIWRIELSAPQYPEGLVLLIFSNKLAGNVDIINGLNHYIGMKALHSADFLEFTILPFIIGFFSFALLLTAILGKRRLLNIVFVLFVCFGIIAMIDFWRWDYNYGHNLNPDAAIIVPGMAYQPPLIGYKQLLNFGAYSIPDTGGWLFIGVGIILLVLVAIEWKSYRKWKKKFKPVSSTLPVLMLLLLLNSCNTGPQPIITGKDHCDFCKMPVSDNRFGAEVITTKGKVFKFDDAHCVLSFLHSDGFKNEQQYTIYFVDFSGKHELMPAEKASYLKSDALRSPMNGNIAAFQSSDSLQTALQKFPGTALNWNELNRP